MAGRERKSDTHMTKMIALTAALLAARTPAVAATVISVEAPGVKSSTVKLAYGGVETFDSRTAGSNRAFSTTFGNNGVVTGSYSGVTVSNANQYGGAGGTGRFATIASTAGYTLTLNSTDARGLNYFGLWISAIDGLNQLTFLKNGRVVDSFSASALNSLIGNDPRYRGNPDGTYKGLNTGERYAFVNFSFDRTKAFDTVRLAQSTAGAGFESDNHTVGFNSAAVPEPATWGMLIFGFGMVGGALRRRAPMVATQAA